MRGYCDITAVAFHFPHHSDACTDASVGPHKLRRDRTRNPPKIACVSTLPQAGSCSARGHHIPSIFQPFIDGMSTQICLTGVGAL